MKTNLIAVLLLSFASVSFASDMPIVSNEKSKTLTVTTQSWKGGTLEIMIKDVNGDVIHSETIKNEKIARSYDVRQLPQGHYTIEMSNGIKTTKQNFEIYASEVFLNKDIETIFNPVVVIKENSVDVNSFAPKTRVTITDFANNVILSETITTSTVHKRYNTTNLPTGEYVVNVESNGKFTSRNFVK
jgi:hypothetical protein